MARLAILLLVLVCVSLQANSRELRSLLSQEGLKCKKSPGGKKHGMELLSKYGPCSKIKPGSNFSYEHIFLQDRLEVDSVLAKLGKTPEQPTSVTLPTTSAASIGYGGYYVNVGLGTPKTQLSLALNSGSSLTWTQCQPCLIACYDQVEPLFNPANSSSYTEVGCKSQECSSSFLQKHFCSETKPTCVYNETVDVIGFSAGFFARETLTLTPTEVLSGFYFGCGQQNVGIFDGVAGFLGLGVGNASLAYQASSLYGKRFSYCLPTMFSDSTGHLTLGNATLTSTNISYTPFKTVDNLPYYFVQLQSISLGDKLLSISSDVETIVYSNTAFTFLPNSTYAAIRDAFKEFMDGKGYPSIPSPIPQIDLPCYNLTGFEAQLPTTKLAFQGGLEIKLNDLGVVTFASETNDKEVCLAFSPLPLSIASNTIVVGSLAQQTFDVVYDIDGSKIGFGAAGC